MKNLLFLVHRIPFPPNKGDKIRSYNILRYLANNYRVFLGAFVDDSYDWRYVHDVESLCVESCFLPLQPRKAKIGSLKGFLSGQALTLPYYFDPRMCDWVDKITCSHNIDQVLVFSSAMAQYVEISRFEKKVIDFVDVDSDKWRQYANGKSWPLSWVYQREGRLLLEYERRISEQFDLSIFVSEKEANMFKCLAPTIGNRVTHIDNGVDTDYFSPEHHLHDPYCGHELVMVFTGAMDYWANVDAVVWFAEEIFVQVHQHIPNARFYIVGAKPTNDVKKLQGLDGVQVTGTVEDVRPYLKYARISVAPMRIARGVQNKVLEAMAMGNLVVATNAAIEGIEIPSDLDIVITDDADSMAQIVIAGLSENSNLSLSENNRQAVLDKYSWQKNLSKLGSIMENEL